MFTTLKLTNSYFKFAELLLSNLLPQFTQLLMTTEEGSSGSATSKIWLSFGKSVFESVNPSEIIYVEVKNHHIHINLTEERKYEMKSSLSEFYQKSLNEFSYFRKIGRRYIVNIKRIDRVENNRLIMEGNNSIPIPRDRKEEVLREVGIRIG